MLHTEAAWGSVVLAVPEPELARAADVIAFGQIVHTQTEIADGRVVTHATMQVLDAIWHTTVKSFLELYVPGGNLPNRLVATAPGAPRLKNGDMVFGFFQKLENGVVPLGLSYGLLRVRSTQSGDLRVYRELDGLQFVDRSGNPVSTESIKIADVPLKEFAARIRQHLSSVGPVDPSSPSTVKQ